MLETTVERGTVIGGTRRPPRRASRLPTRTLRRLVSPLLILLLWQAASWTGLVSPQTLASPLRILSTATDLTRDGTLPENLLVSLARAGIGLAIAVVAGTGLALAAGLSRFGEEAIDAPMQMLRTLPALALVPLFILWFGIGELPKVAVGGARLDDPDLPQPVQRHPLDRPEAAGDGRARSACRASRRSARSSCPGRCRTC